MALNILLIEPYFTGSHAAWATGYQKNSRHQIDILAMKGQFWKWRMHGGAITAARLFEKGRYRPDLILATDMLDLTTFLSLTRRFTAGIPAAVYFHENQFAYPWSPDDRDVAQNRDQHYRFINYSSALAAEAVFFNSQYNRTTFLQGLEPFLKHFPDYNELGSINVLREKSKVLPLGLDLNSLENLKVPKDDGPPIILWNHRWEFDKNPAEFFAAVDALADDGLEFRLALLGENFRKSPVEFLKAREKYGDRIVHYGYATGDQYVHWLWRSHILPVTSQHDFFGISVVEAAYCGCRLLLPNRLAYPEIFPPFAHRDCFYNDLAELVHMLKTAVMKFESFDPTPFQVAAAKYGWEKMGPLYDECMENLVSA